MENIDEEEPVDFSGVEGGEIVTSPSPSPARSPPPKKAKSTSQSPPLPKTKTPIKDRDFRSDRADRGGTPTSRADWLGKPSTLTTTPSPPKSGRSPDTLQ
jgi:hypothetical protein